MNEFELPTKIIWRRSANIDAANAFYPSLYKDIQKRDLFFQENFEVVFVNADREKMQTTFLPIYTEEIINRPDFTLDRDTIIENLLLRVSAKNNYKFMFIYYQKELVSATFFSIRDHGLHIGYRALNKNFDKKLSHKATVGCWGEKLIQEYGKEQGVAFFSYGKDSHPFLDKNIGRPLYKIKTGMLPKMPESKTPFSIEKISEEKIKSQGKSLLFFSDNDPDGLFKRCTLYSQKGLLSESYLNEFDKVLTWAGIIFNSSTY